MLPRLYSPYGTPPSFVQLADDVPDFAPFLRNAPSGGATIDWKDDVAVRALTSALLERDFQLSIELPEDRLCPTVPSRLEYVLFVLRLALLTSNAPSTSKSLPSLVGLDIGTGASAIYALLACRTYPPRTRPSTSAAPRQLRMLATDIDSRSLSSAERNIARNKLGDRIKLFEANGEILPPELLDGEERIDFTMCNPPFYSSSTEISASLAAKKLEPFAVCTGSSNELLTEGGEVAFVSRMIEESLDLGKQKIRWFTSLLGKFSSISPLITLLKQRDIYNYAVTPLPPHGQTTRWILAWSLQDWRFPPELLHPCPFSSSNSSASPSPSFPGSEDTTASSTASEPSPAFTQPTTRFLPPSLLPSTFYLPTPSLPSPSQHLTLIYIRTVLNRILSELCPPAPPSVGNKSRGQRELGGEGGGEGGAEGKALFWQWQSGALDRDEEEGEDTSDNDLNMVEVTARRNVWSRGARRAAAGKGQGRKQGRATEVVVDADAAVEDKPSTPLLVLRVRVCIPPVPANEHFPDAESNSTSATTSQEAGDGVEGKEQPSLVATWAYGSDSVRQDYVAFWGFLCRKVGEACRAVPVSAGTAAEEQEEVLAEERAAKRRKVGEVR
ncbi:hypothetical protein JCM11641_001986 [Rhodosporidiobolus odoratus]